MESYEIRQWNETRRGSVRRAEDAHRIVGELLLRFGVTPHLCGFDALSSGIRLTAERERSAGMRGVDGNGGKYLREHVMRIAIGSGFQCADTIHAQTFPFSDRPSNSEFICTLATLAHDRMMNG